MSRALILCTVLLVSGCGGEAPLTLRTPHLLQAQGGAITATATFTPDEGDADPEEVELEQTDDGYTGSVKLRPGDYTLLLHYSYADGDGAVPLAEYRDVWVTVEAREASQVGLDIADLVYVEFDEDQDGIPNLDELRFDYQLRVAETDPAPPEQRRTIVTGPVTVQIGSDDPLAALVERPMHDVVLETYALDLYEVSVDRYRVCVARRICAPPLSYDQMSFFTPLLDGERPVTGVPLAQARAFCEDFAGGRLPTEREWEYAARPRGTDYPWGDDIAQDVSRCEYVNARFPTAGDDRACVNGPQGRADLVKVDALDTRGCATLPGPLDDQHDGPCHLAGNVWEWTESRFLPYPGADWGPDWEPEMLLYVLRGGSADSLDMTLRSSFRVGADAELVSNPFLVPYVGLRCAYGG